MTAKNIFMHTDDQDETLLIDEFTLKSGRKLIMLRIQDEDQNLRASVQLSPQALLNLRHQIDDYVIDGGGF